MSFEGFPAELPDFLWGLTLNNEKPWFEANRDRFERCLKQPFSALAWDCLEEMERRYPGMTPGLHIARIHRDARRLFGRGPYKDHLWFTLGKTSALYASEPRFWFEIDAHSWSCGMGFFRGDASLYERWRASMDDNPKPLEKLVRAINRQNYFTFCSRPYKKPKGDPGKLLYDWYNARDIALEHEAFFEPDTVPGPALREELTTAFGQLMPLYRYLLKLCD